MSCASNMGFLFLIYEFDVSSASIGVLLLTSLLFIISVYAFFGKNLYVMLVVLHVFGCQLNMSKKTIISVLYLVNFLKMLCVSLYKLW